MKVIDPDREENTTQFVYDVGDRPHYLNEIVDPLGRSGVRTEYDEQGRLKRTIDVDDDAIEFIYDPNNSIQTVRDAYGNPTTYEYDDRGNVVQQQNAYGHSTFLVYDEDNNITKVTDPNGNIATYIYDNKGNVLTRTEFHNPDDQNPDTTRYTYDRFGNQTSITLPTGATFEMKYDSKGNLLEMRDDGDNLIQSFTYDSRGLITSESDPFGTTRYSNFDRFGNPHQIQDPDGKVTTATYTSQGLLETMTDEDGISTFTYDKEGREKRADYGNGIYVEYDYEGAGRDWTTLDAPTIGHIERRFTDDGKLGGWLTPGEGEITFTYDRAGRLETETDPSGNITRYTYDAVGRVQTVTDEQTGLITEYHYDTLIGDDPDPDVDDNLIGRQTGQTIVLDGNTRYTNSSTYYADGQVKTTTDPRNNTWFYRYTPTTTTIIDPLGRETTTVQSSEYLPVEILYPDGTRETSEYLFGNNLSEGDEYPTVLTDRGGNDRTYTYDELGRLQTATDLGDCVAFCGSTSNEHDENH